MSFATTSLVVRSDPCLPIPMTVDHITIWRGLVEEKIVPAEEANLLPF